MEFSFVKYYRKYNCSLTKHNLRRCTKSFGLRFNRKISLYTVPSYSRLGVLKAMYQVLQPALTLTPCDTTRYSESFCSLVTVLLLTYFFVVKFYYCMGPIWDFLKFVLRQLSSSKDLEVFHIIY